MQARDSWSNLSHLFLLKYLQPLLLPDCAIAIFRHIIIKAK